MIYRKAIRAVMLTPQREMLLIQVEEPSTNFRVWVTPGGGIEPGEDAHTCLRREIREETGLNLATIGPLIWCRQLTFEWDGQPINQHEEYYLVQIDLFTPNMQTNPSKTELMAIRQFRWWNHHEIAASNDQFAPRLLTTHLESLILNGPPDNPLDVGI